MSQPELLKLTTAALGAARIAYMVTGSTASSLQGAPRQTHDIDIVVELTAADIPKLAASFPDPAYYFSAEAARDAVRNRSMFNVLSVDDGDKVDFWLLTDEPFDQSRFARRRTVTAAGVTFDISTPEDTIVAKLRWARLSGGSLKQFQDAQQIYEVQFETLDLGYINEWSARLNVHDLWHQLQSTATLP